MSRFNRKNQELAANAFANFSVTLAKALLGLLVVALTMLSVKDKTSDGIKLNAEFTIETHWADGSHSDVDTWLQLPSGDVVWYQAKEVGLAALERDDTGSNNSIVLDGKTIESQTRMEIVSLRGIVPGEYILSLLLYRYDTPIKTSPTQSPIQDHGYSDPDNGQNPSISPYVGRGAQSNEAGKDLPEPLSATIEIKKINPKIQVVFAGKAVFTKYRQELHIVRFTITADGNVEGVSTELPTSVVIKHYDPNSFSAPEGAM